MKHRSPAGLAGLVLALLLAAPAVAAGPANVDLRVEGARRTLVRGRAVTTDAPAPAAARRPGRATLHGHERGRQRSSRATARRLGRRTSVRHLGSWTTSSTTILRRGRRVDTSRTGHFWRQLRRRPSVGVCGDRARRTATRCCSTSTASAPVAGRCGSRGSRRPRRPGRRAGHGRAVDRRPARRPGRAARRSVGGRSSRRADGIAQRRRSRARAPSRCRRRRPARAARRPSRPVRHERATAPAAASPPPDTHRARRHRSPASATASASRAAARRASCSGTVSADPSGLWAVKIRLTRRYKGTCWYFSGSKEQFLKRTCGKQYAFKVGDRADWSYLLPRAPAARPLRARHLRDRQRRSTAARRAGWCSASDEAAGRHRRLARRSPCPAPATAAEVEVMVVGKERVLRAPAEVRLKVRTVQGRRPALPHRRGHAAVGARGHEAEARAARLRPLRQAPARRRRPVRGARQARAREGPRRLGLQGRPAHAQPRRRRPRAGRLRDGRRVTWFWCEQDDSGGCQRTLEARPDRTTAAPGETLTRRRARL